MLIASFVYIIILPCVHCLTVPYFSKLSDKRHDFQKKKVIEQKFVLIFSTTFVPNISHIKRIQWVIIINAHRSSCKVPFILVRL